jgi:hypothetical protein
MNAFSLPAPQAALKIIKVVPLPKVTYSLSAVTLHCALAFSFGFYSP